VLTEVTRSSKRVLRGSIIADEEMEKSVLTEVTRSNQRVLRGSIIADEKMEKSVLTEVTRSIKRVLRGSIIADEEMDATLKSEVFFNTTDGNPSGLRETSFPVPPASKKWKNKELTIPEWWERFVYLYPTLVF